MAENQVTINELAARMRKELRRVGYVEETIYRNFFPLIRTVVKYYTAAGITYYSVASTNEFIEYQKERYQRGEITEHRYRAIRSIGTRMNEFFITVFDFFQTYYIQKFGIKVFVKAVGVICKRLCKLR